MNNVKIYAYPNPTTVLFAKRVHFSDQLLNNFFIYSNRPNDARLYLSSESEKATIQKLIDSGWSFPHITKRFINIYASVDHSLDPSELKATLTRIIELKP